MSIKFSNKKSTTSTVNRLLDSVLPGHSTEVDTGRTHSLSQAIKKSQNYKTTPEEARRIKKNLKVQKKKEIRVNKKKNDKVAKTARLQLLQDHFKQGLLTKEESLELKKLIKQNVANIQAWEIDEDDEEDLIDIQDSIMDLEKKDYKKETRRRINKKAIYEKPEPKTPNSFKGLTPGLAPVWMEDEGESSDEY